MLFLGIACCVAGIAQACRTLAGFPLSGRRYNDEYRCIVFRSHLIFAALTRRRVRSWSRPCSTDGGTSIAFSMTIALT